MSQAVVSKRRWRRHLGWRETVDGWLFILPWLVGFLAFIAGPMVASALISLTEWKILKPPEWVGLGAPGDGMPTEAALKNECSGSGRRTFERCASWPESHQVREATWHSRYCGWGEAGGLRPGGAWHPRHRSLLAWMPFPEWPFGSGSGPVQAAWRRLGRELRALKPHRRGQGNHRHTGLSCKRHDASDTGMQSAICRLDQRDGTR